MTLDLRCAAIFMLIHSSVGRLFQEEEVLLMANARAEEVVRKAEAKLKKQREQEIKDAEREAAEMADLMANDPEVRRVVDPLDCPSTKAPQVKPRKKM